MLNLRDLTMRKLDLNYQEKIKNFIRINSKMLKETLKLSEAINSKLEQIITKQQISQSKSLTAATKFIYCSILASQLKLQSAQDTNKIGLVKFKP